MDRSAISLILLSATALGACGSSSNSAPIVYGTPPSSVARVYNTPADVYLRGAGETQPLRSAAYAASTYPAPTYPAPTYAAAAPQAYPAPGPTSGPIPGYGQPAPIARETALYSQVVSEPYGAPVPTATAPTHLVTVSSAPTGAPLAPRYASSIEPLQTPSGGGAVVVIVEPGDTVYAIARRTGASPEAIIAENRLAPPYRLEIGERLRVSGARGKVDNVTASAAQAAPVRQDAYSVHIVRPGDTLYSIARASGAPVSAIAQANGLRSPFSLAVGQRLNLPVAGAPPSTQTVYAPNYGSAATSAPSAVDDIARTVSYGAPSRLAGTGSALFVWPVKGAVIGRYGLGELGRRNEGVNIAAPVGTPVRAAADGEVVYRGSEVDGYGNLLLIKHSDDFVTAYAHNDVLLVRKGQRVQQGQVIAKVGQTGDATEPQLHFEIRQNLKSVDPLALLDTK